MKQLACLLLFVSTLIGGASSARGQAAGAFARMGFGARGVAMSNALVADASGDVSPYYNPALAPFIGRQHLQVSTAFMSLDRDLQFLQLAAPLKPSAGIAAGLIRAGVSNIDGRDESGYHTQTYSTSEYAAFLAFGLKMHDRASLGVALQYFYTDLAADVPAVKSIGLDVGATLQATEALRLGVAVDDLLARYSWDTSDRYGSAGRSTSDRFPARIRLGAAYALLDRQVLVTAEYESRFTSSEVRTRDVRIIGGAPSEVFVSDRILLHDSLFRLGAEYHPVEAFAVRGGVDGIGSGDLGDVRPSAGFMAQQELGSLLARAEYAFVLEPYALGTMHLITFKLFL